jgi:thymidylate synthase ThyX
MNGGKERKIYVIDPRDVGQEVIAVLFAKASRDPRSFREILLELTEKEAAKFHERWVIGYGHSSVAEHAVLHIALEGISRLAVVAVEHSRLASYTEKSTRYQEIDEDNVFVPRAIGGNREQYLDIMNQLFKAYKAAIVGVQEVIMKRFPRKQDEAEQKYDSRIRTKIMDYCRAGLPLAVLVNLGWTANARVVEEMCAMMQSHELEEVREIGRQVKQVALEQAPTLVKYADQREYLMKTDPRMRQQVSGLWVPEDYPGVAKVYKPGVELVGYDQLGEDKFLAGWLYRFGGGTSFNECMKKVAEMSEEAKFQLIKSVFEGLGTHDKAGRESELPKVTIDAVLTFADYYDLKRNRMMTQIVQEITTRMGFILPALIYEVGVGEKMSEAITCAHQLADLLRGEIGMEHQYLFTNATLMRMLLDMNLREVVELWKTRGSPTANAGYRFLVLAIGELVKQQYPTMWKFMTASRDYPASEQIYHEYYGA